MDERVHRGELPSIRDLAAGYVVPPRFGPCHALMAGERQLNACGHYRSIVTARSLWLSHSAEKRCQLGDIGVPGIGRIEMEVRAFGLFPLIERALDAAPTDLVPVWDGALAPFNSRSVEGTIRTLGGDHHESRMFPLGIPATRCRLRPSCHAVEHN